MTNVPHKIIYAIIIGPYLAIMSLMCLVMLIGPLLIAVTLVIIGCISLFIQWINFYLVLCKWRLSRWWWLIKKNF
jgi:hypothetical protein